MREIRLRMFGCAMLMDSNWGKLCGRYIPVSIVCVQVIWKSHWACVANRLAIELQCGAFEIAGSI